MATTASNTLACESGSQLHEDALSAHAQAAFELETLERMLDRILLGNHFSGCGQALHGVGNGVLGCFVVVLVDLGVVFSGWVNEHAANNYQIFSLIGRNHLVSDRIRYGFGNGSLGRPNI